MKLSKVLSLVLAVVMLFGMQTFAFTDVAATANYAEAVQVLSALDIITGYGDGTFKPEGKITRAEYAAIVCRILDMGDAGANQVGGYFTDVAADHWASGYIATASQLGIVNGMGDGTFAPSAEVTYEQAVAMLVRALGYERKAQSLGGYPTGYMMIANQESITVGTANTAGGAARSTVARLTYNALTVPMMDQTSWGTDEKFEPIATQSILWTKLSAIKAEVKFDVVPLSKTETDATVTINPLKMDRVAKANYDEVPFTVPGTVKMNGVDLTGLQGLTATAIIDKADAAEWKLITVVAKAGKNVEITVDPALLQEATISSTDNYVEYKKTADDDRNTKIKVLNDSTSMKVYKNLVAGSWSDVAVGGNTGDVAYRFTDTDNDGTYETVFVDNIGIFVVGSVNTKTFKIQKETTNANAQSTFTGTIVLDPEVETVAWSLTDAEGNALELADIEAGDVAAVAKSDDGTNTYYEIVITKNTIEGTVSQSYKENGKVYYTIGDADYTMLIPESGSTTLLNPGDAITATVYGDKIVCYDVAEGVKNYAVVIDTHVATDFGTTYQVQVLTTAGEIVTLNLADKVNTTVDTTAAAYATTFAADFAADNIVAYSLNNAGEIKAYDIASAGNFGSANVRGDDKADYQTGKAYYESREKLDNYFITENTVVVITKDGYGLNTKAEYAVASIDMFDETETYDYFAVYNDNKEAKFVVLYQQMDKVNMGGFPLVVTKVSTVSVANDYRAKLVGYIDGEEVELVTAEGVSKTLLGVNDIAMIATNADGEITAATILAKYVDGTGYEVVDNSAHAADDEKLLQNGTKQTIKFAPTFNTANLNTFFTAGTTDAETLKGFGIAGKVHSLKGKTMNLVQADDYASTLSGSDRFYGVNDALITDFTFNPAANAYVYDVTSGKIKVASISDVDTEKSTGDWNDASQLDNDDAVYVYNYDGETKLILIVDING